jgi:hypothetical protein
LHSSPLSLVILLSATACILPDFDPEGRQCPCAPGYSCDVATNICVGGDGPDTTSSPDSTSTGPTGGADGGAPPTSGGAPPTGAAPTVGGFGTGGSGATGGEGTGGAPPPLEGTCGAPIAIADPGGVVATTVGQGDDVTAGCYDASGPDVAYSVVAAITGTMQLTLYSQAELFIYARTDCFDEATQLFCVDDNGTNAIEVATLSVTSGQVVYVVVDGHGGEESEFTLDVITTPP